MALLPLEAGSALLVRSPEAGASLILACIAAACACGLGKR